jgi:methylmalonyl-CoA mutase N-terminal domain/subunit
VLHIDESAESKQIERLDALKRRRNSSDVAKTLGVLRRSAESAENTMPYILEAVRAYATVGEICGALKDVFGSYTETSFL